MRHREPRAGSVLHVVRRRAVVDLPERARPRTRPAPSSASSAGRASGRVDRAWWRLRRSRRPSRPRPPGWRRRERPRPQPGRAVRRPAPGRRHAGLGLARRRSAGGAPQGDGAVRRPVRLHGGRRAHGPRGREVDHRPGAAPAGTGGRPLRRLRRQVHRRQRDGGVRCAGRPRGRPRACRPRRPCDAGRDGGDQPGHRRRGRGQLLVAGRDQLRRRAGRPGRRRLHGDGRRGQRRRAPAGGGKTRKRHRRRDHPPSHPRRDRVRRAGAADPQGQVRAGGGVGGRPRAGPRSGNPGRPHRGAADRPRGRVGAALVAVRAGGPRKPPAPGHGHRPGRGRQVAPASRAGGADRRAAGEAGLPGRALSRLRRRARLLGARRDPPRPVRARRHRRLRAGVGEAPARGGVGRLRRRDRRAARADRRDDRPPAGHRAPGRARDGDRRPRRSTTRSRSATACSPLCARWSRR